MLLRRAEKQAVSVEKALFDDDFPIKCNAGMIENFPHPIEKTRHPTDFAARTYDSVRHLVEVLAGLIDFAPYQQVSQRIWLDARRFLSTAAKYRLIFLRIRMDLPTV